MVTVVTAVAAVLTFVRRVEVHGESMLPALRPGDRLLVLRAFRARRGQLVVFGDPRRRRRTLVKRVVTTKRPGRRVEVAGDNSASSTDSTVFGPVRVTGRVVYRYHPPDRAGRVS